MKLVPALATLLCSLAPAAAYERAASPPPDNRPLFWHAVTVPFVIDAAGSADVATDAEIEAVRRGFQTWADVGCSYLGFRDEGVRPGLGLGTPQNVVVWVESGWRGATSAIALTTLTFVNSTGQLLSADIQLNGQDYQFSAEATGVAGRIDVEAVATHEVGHFLGLAHSAVPGATMTRQVGAGETFARDLADDDIQGICAIYPVGSEPPVDSFTPPGGCGQVAATDGRPGAASNWLWLVALVAILLRRRQADRAAVTRP